MQVIGPMQVQIGGLGLFDLPAESVFVSGASPSGEALETGSQRLGDKVWIEAVPELDGRIYPGVPFTVSYYCYARIYVEDVEFWWSAPEFGTATCLEAPVFLDWKLVEYGLQKCLLCVLEITPACPGSLQVPSMETYMRESTSNPFQKGFEYYPVSRPVSIPVYPYPGERPANWSGCLIDSVALEIRSLDSYSGQGGEKYIRLTVSGPGSVLLRQPPDLTIEGPARILHGTSGESENKRWWDLVIDPWDTGTVILGPDSIAWFDRGSGTFRQARVNACTLNVESLPWNPVELEFEPPDDDGASFWLFLAVGAVSLLTAALIIRSHKRRPGVTNLSAAVDSEELMTAFEAALSTWLRGRRGYLESSELSELLEEKGVESMLSRRIVRFWKDIERLLTGREPSPDVFGRLLSTALQLIDELKEDLSGR